MYIMKGRTKGSIGELFLFVIICTIYFKLNDLTGP